MRVNFKQAVHIAGKDYHRGIHEVPEKHLNHPHFAKFAKAGFLTEDKPAKAAPVKSPAERKQELDQLIAEGKKVAFKQGDAPVVEEAAFEPESAADVPSEESGLIPSEDYQLTEESDSVDESKESKKKNKHSKR